MEMKSTIRGGSMDCPKCKTRLIRLYTNSREGRKNAMHAYGLLCKPCMQIFKVELKPLFQNTKEMDKINIT